MDHNGVLTELFGRIDGHVEDVLDGLETSDLTWRPESDVNPIGWLLWHLTRVIDHQIADVAGKSQVWVTGDWASGFGLAPDPHNTGYGHDEAAVAAVQPRDHAVLGDYYAHVADHTAAFLSSLTADALDAVVDDQWDPPVTLGVRLISIADDAIQHAGAAAYLKGMLPR